MPATTYTMRMLAINNIDHSSYTEAVVVKTQEEAPVEFPHNVNVKAVGQGELFVTWQPPARENWNGELLGYVVSWLEQGSPKNVSKTMTVKGWATTKLQLMGLRKYTKYDVQIRAYNSVSAGPPSHPITGTTLEGGWRNIEVMSYIVLYVLFSSRGSSARNYLFSNHLN